MKTGGKSCYGVLKRWKNSVLAKLVQPSTKREGFSSIPNVKWEDVGGLDSLRRDFERSIVDRIKYPDEYEPPGFGKTLIAKAVAYEAGANCIHIK
ncbi:cell division control protein 48 homolog C, partial [Tanacetum coccineum]